MKQSRIKCLAFFLAFLFTNAFSQEDDLKNPKELFELGSAYQYGQGVPKDEKKAAELYKKALEKGPCPEALINLSVMYFLGKGGLPKDEKKAVELLHQAADQNHPLAMFKLAGFYLGGIAGLPKDKEKALKLLHQAADQGLPEAKLIRDQLGNKTFSTQHVPEKRNKKSRPTSLEEKMYLAAKYAHGEIGLDLTQEERDIKAAELYKESNLPPAQFSLADMYYEGRAGQNMTQAEKDVEAIRLLQESGLQHAKYLLAVMYLQGRAGLSLSKSEQLIESERLFRESGVLIESSRTLSFLHEFSDGEVKFNIDVQNVHAYGFRPVALKISPDGQTLYIANFSSECISAVKTSNPKEIISIINIGERGRQVLK
jgi:TPR repeat protein